jgi:hypothetical protein
MRKNGEQAHGYYQIYLQRIELLYQSIFRYQPAKDCLDSSPEQFWTLRNRIAFDDISMLN